MCSASPLNALDLAKSFPRVRPHSTTGVQDPGAPARPVGPVLVVVVQVVYQVGVIVKPMTMSMSLIAVTGVIAVLTICLLPVPGVAQNPFRRRVVPCN